MRAQQIVLPFCLAKSPIGKHANRDLIGRTYDDDYVKVTVVGMCDIDDTRVLVERRPGYTSPMPGWLMRVVFEEEDKKRKQAA